jgi:hypothetical protein
MLQHVFVGRNKTYWLSHMRAYLRGGNGCVTMLQANAKFAEKVWQQ